MLEPEPTAYTIGWIPFLSATIWLDSRPLIPRPETEFWVNEALREVQTAPHHKILDLCAGSGAIGIAALLELLDAHVDFVEKEVRHHSTIQKNLVENGIQESRARILAGDLFEHVSEQYDVILTNPPYIDPAKVHRTQESVLNYEPHEALFGGERGVELIVRILQDAPQHLVSGGLLYIEHEPEQVEEIAQTAAALPYTSCESLQDQYGVLRYTRLKRA